MPPESRLLTPDPAGIAAAAAVLRAGGLVAVPTETVYGLAARADDGAAVAGIYAAKGRPSFNPLIVHVADVAQAETLAVFSPLAHALADMLWPGPLTLVLPRRADAPVASLVTAGLDTIALRCPAHAVMQALVRSVGPLAAPSANASGRISPTRAGHVLESLADVPVIDAGPCAAGVESTIVAIEGDGWRLLRPGAVAVEAIVGAAGAPLPPRFARVDLSPAGRGDSPSPLPAGERSRDGDAGPGEGSRDRVIAPGMMESHYAPQQPVRLEAVTAGSDEYHIGFGAVAGDATLSASGDLTEAAARLFDLLHVAQASGRAGIAVAPVPRHGLGLAINDRLTRAAAPRG
ncbi:L-threonylcarbamoyladenylate synthase [Sandarakinorhabdus sp. AAP62]|uniref:L-threonylcarbamoyladenylate synthase n=1 Tax=Sandarakinorhabdus sp. AAP62 TaxID=1248916 RepID=UPI0003022E89|nr:L-threonylcarbamoyladenylate synthase [Sandarakinorhabdus sp. AAP62]